jgi:hypothetical protein
MWSIEFTTFDAKEEQVVAKFSSSAKGVLT